MPTDPVTRHLLAAREGDRLALASFVRATQADVWRLCAHLVGRDTADDLTQEVYVRALQALPRFRADASARTWLLAIARRACADEVRARARRRRRDAALRPADAAPSETGHVDLTLLVAQLRHERREAFVLTQVVGLPYAETAAICRVPVGTVRSRVARAREDLLALLSAAEVYGS